MIQYACNLSCRGCITMTDYLRKGSVSIEQGEPWLAAWSQQLDIGTICLFGGEPLMNKDIVDWIKLVRQYWPNSIIKIITNGTYLNNKNIIPVLLEVGNAEYQISLHWRAGTKFNEIKKALIAQLGDQQWKVHSPNRSEVLMAFECNSVTVQLAVFGEFVIPYKGYGSSMKPWNSTDTSASYSNCGSPMNPILYENRLYKCGPIANLKDTLQLHDRLLDPDWQYYLKYQGIGVEDDLTSFVENFDKPHNICSMCSSDRSLSNIDHYSPGAVAEKKEIRWLT